MEEIFLSKKKKENKEIPEIGDNTVKNVTTSF